MPRALFADSLVTRRRRGVGAVPASLAVHGLVIGAAALYAARPVAVEMPQPPMTPLTAPVLVAVAPRPVEDPVPARPTPPRLHSNVPPAPAGQTAESHAGPRPDLTGNASGDPTADAPAPCLHNCDGAEPDGSGDGGFLVGPIEGSPSPGPGSGRPLPVGGDIRPPLKLRDVRPVYPEVARLARVGALVIVQCVIGTDGRVTEATVLRGHPLLDAAALDAVRQWTYRPTLLNGTPVAVQMTVTIQFHVR